MSVLLIFCTYPCISTENEYSYQHKVKVTEYVFPDDERSLKEEQRNLKIVRILAKFAIEVIQSFLLTEKAKQ